MPVHAQTPAEFAADLRAACETIEGLTGQRPSGYRAPAFSITRQCAWAFDALADEGFAYDASEHDSPRIRNRLIQSTAAPHRLELTGRTLWEFPVAVWRWNERTRLPVGGASYWGVSPTSLVLKGLTAAGPMAGLYLHPHELDPEPLDAQLPAAATAAQRLQGIVRGAQRNLARRRAADVLRAIAGRHPLIPYGEAHARLESDGAGARP